jgi:hypothetical protein
MYLLNQTYKFKQPMECTIDNKHEPYFWGFATQLKAMKQVCGNLKLELASL